MTRPIYLDHHATTPLDARVREAMYPFLESEFGNPASAHDWGQRAARAVEKARGEVAELIHAAPAEIVFTAGATEADNIAVKGAARFARRRGQGTHLVTSGIEHKAVIESMKALVSEGFSFTEVAPDPNGIVDAGAVEEAIGPETVLVSLIGANAEIGTTQPVGDVGARCRGRGVLFHTDATQLVGKLEIDVQTAQVDLLSLSAHKFHGPKGVGALYIRSGVEVEPLFSGGGQERGIRSGTLNVAGIVGLGAAARIRQDEMDDEAKRLTSLRDDLWAAIREEIPDAILNGCPIRRLPGNLNVIFPGCEGGALLAALPEFALSTGSACLSGDSRPSEVLLAIGRSDDDARCALRIGLGAVTTAKDVASLAAALAEVVPQLRQTVSRST